MNGVFKWLPLKQHLIDTNEIIKLLWEHWLSDRQKQIIITSLDDKNEERAKQLVGFLASIHDLGKATPAFQAKQSFYSSIDLDLALLDKLENVGFNGIQQMKLRSERKSPHVLAGQALLESYGVAQDISSIIGAHHGKPEDNQENVKYQLMSYPANYFQNQNQQDKVHKKWANAQEKIFHWALNLNGFKNIQELPKVNQVGQVILSGLLIMSDWIASNEKFFPLINMDDHKVPDQEIRKQTGWLAWFNTYSWNPEEFIDATEAYEKRLDFDEPRDMQAKFFEVIQRTKEVGIYILEAPMGGGKTEAALIGVEQLAEKTGTTGMYFGLPTQATSDGIFDRIFDWIKGLSVKDGERSIQLIHGKSELNDSYKNLPRATNIADDLAEGVIANEWFAGRKTAVLDEFVVGTIDQFLMMSLKQKHLMLRHLGFSKKVIVIDEVHAYDAYMNQYLERALRWIGAYDIPVIILSATLPSKIRIQLMKAYMRGQGHKWREVEKPKDWDTTIQYPLITFNDGNEIKQECDIKVSNNKQIFIKSIKENDLLCVLEEELSDGGIAGVIVNTVRKAQTLAESIEHHFGEEQVEILHSSFIATDRIEKEKQLLNNIGKGDDRPDRKIIIGTQVIEQSLDIDFDLLISELAPMDLLIQRIGRLHRHDLDFRPVKLQQPTTYVMGMDEKFDFDSGSKAVYGAYLLIRTQILLPETINLPGDISKLVQATYSDEDLQLPEYLISDYEKAKSKYNNKIEQKKSKAKGFQLDKPDLRGSKNLIGWLDSQFRADSEQRSEAQVRDIEETIEIIALNKKVRGYGFFNSAEDISQKIDQSNIQKEIVKHSLRLPHPLSTVYRIEKTIDELELFNKKHLGIWQTSSWLKGELGVIFDENNEFVLNGFRLKYSPKYGLRYEKEDQNE